MIKGSPSLPRSLRLYACNGILFHHESPLRGETFVHPQESQGRWPRIKLGQQESLKHRQCSTRVRDWGHARRIMSRCSGLMLQAGGARGIYRSSPPGAIFGARDFVLAAAAALDMTNKFRKATASTRLAATHPARSSSSVDPPLFPRPTEVETLLGERVKAKQKLGLDAAERSFARPGGRDGPKPDLKEAERHG